MNLKIYTQRPLTARLDLKATLLLHKPLAFRMDRSLIVDGYETFTHFIKTHRSVQFAHLQWIDYTSTVRVRTLTLKHLESLIKAGTNLALCRHYLCLIDIGLPLIDRDPGRPAGQCHLIPDFETIHLYPGTTGEHAVIFCYFGSGTRLPRGISTTALTLSAPFCPRRALLRAIDQGRDEFNLSFRVGFEFEFSAVQTSPTPSPPEVHASSGLRAIEAFMLPILSTVTTRLAAAGVHIEQFHCEGSDDAYELVTAHRPPLEAVDALVTAKETTRRTCRENGVRMACYPAPPEINGLHTNVSVVPLDDEHYGPRARQDVVAEVEEHFLAGVLAHLGALCAFAMPRPESYARTVAGQWCAGRYVSWGTENREGPVRKRAPGLWELRVPDASAQMYLFVAGVLFAGMDGVRRGTELTVSDCQGEF